MLTRFVREYGFVRMYGDLDVVEFGSYTTTRSFRPRALRVHRRLVVNLRTRNGERRGKPYNRRAKLRPTCVGSLAHRPVYMYG